MSKIIFPLSFVLSGVFVLFASLGPAHSETENKDGITLISDLEKYVESTIEGEITRIASEDEFKLEDKSGKIRVYTGWKNTSPVTAGEKVKVTGKLDGNLIREFYAIRLVKENGSIIEFNKVLEE